MKINDENSNRLKDAQFYSNLSDEISKDSKEKRYLLVADIISTLIRKNDCLANRMLTLNLSSSIISQYFNKSGSEDLFILDEDFFIFVLDKLTNLNFTIPERCKGEKKEIIIYW